MAEVSRKYEIPRSSLRDHYEGRTTNRKMGPKTILSKEEEEKLVEYIEQEEKLQKQREREEREGGEPKRLKRRKDKN